MRMREWSARSARPKLVRCASGPLGLNWSAIVRYGLQKKYRRRVRSPPYTTIMQFLEIVWIILMHFYPHNDSMDHNC